MRSGGATLTCARVRCVRASVWCGDDCDGLSTRARYGRPEAAAATATNEDCPGSNHDRRERPGTGQEGGWTSTPRTGEKGRNRHRRVWNSQSRPTGRHADSIGPQITSSSVLAFPHDAPSSSEHLLRAFGIPTQLQSPVLRPCAQSAAMAMERNWSGDSIASPLLEKPSYIATFDANRPRHHRRRSSLPPGPHRPTASSLNTDAAPDSPVPDYSNTRSASTQHRPLDAAASLRERRKFKDRHRPPHSSTAASSLSTSQKKRPARISTPASSSAQNASGAPPARKSRLASNSSTDVAYSSTYAAGPSSAEERGYSAAQVSADEASSSDAETFQWDVKRRRSSLPPHQSLRSYLAPEGSNHGRAITRQASPLGYRNKTNGPGPREGGSSTLNKPEQHRVLEGSRSRSPAVRPKDLPSSTRHSTGKEGGAAQESSASMTAKAITGNKYSKTLMPRRPKTVNATIEALLLALTGVLACWTLAERDEAVARAKAGGESLSGQAVRMNPPADLLHSLSTYYRAWRSHRTQRDVFRARSETRHDMVHRCPQLPSQRR